MALYLTPGAVRRYIGDPSVPDSDLFPYIDLAEEAVVVLTGRVWGNPGPYTEYFYNVAEDETLHIAFWNPSSVTVKIYDPPDTTIPIELTKDKHFFLLDKGRIQLIPTRYAPVTGLPEVLVKTFLDYWPKVEVIQTSDGSVPAPIIESAAMIAAVAYKQGDIGIGYLRSEKIGDYRYTVSDRAMEEGIIPRPARLLLRHYARRRMVSV